MNVKGDIHPSSNQHLNIACTAISLGVKSIDLPARTAKIDGVSCTTTLPGPSIGLSRLRYGVQCKYGQQPWNPLIQHYNTDNQRRLLVVIRSEMVPQNSL